MERGKRTIKASEAFINMTKQRWLYNITVIENIPSIIQHGILCYDLASKIPHTSIALNPVQERRNKVQIPNGMKLHRYANLYFTYHNPMLYARQAQAEDLCILAVSCSVLDTNGCIVTDRNAATGLVKFYSPEEGIRQIDFDKVFAKFWTHENPYEQSNHKAIKCAEVLVPYKVPYDQIMSACVVSEGAKQKLQETGFDRTIAVRSQVFYR